MKNLVLIILVASVSLLVSGCEPAVPQVDEQQLMRDANFPTEALQALDTGLRQALIGGEYNKYTIIRIAKSKFPERLWKETIIFTGSYDVWCVEVDLGVGSGARDLENYIAKTDEGYLWSLGLSSNLSHLNGDEIWDYYGCQVE